MKKYITVFALALLVFTLSGCDLIQSDTIQTATEEFCLENPDNELCNIDSLDDIEESVVLSLFNDMLENLDTTDIDEYCNQFISADNRELLESCKTDIKSLFPEGIEDYEVLSVMNEEGEYKIELKNTQTDEMFVFSLGITVENDIVVISRMQAGPIFVLSPPDIEESTKLIEAFILDMENSDLTDEQVCEIWYDGVDQDCDGIADERVKFKAGAELSKKVNIIDSDDDDDGILTAIVSFDLDGHVTVLKIAFNYDNSGEELKLMVRHIDSDDDNDSFEDEAVSMIERFILDLENSDLTDEQVCELWDGKDDDCDGIPDARTKFKAGADLSKKVNILDPDSDGDGILVGEVSFDLDGHVTVLKIAFDVEKTETDFALLLRGIESYSPYIPNEGLTMKLEEFISDYEDANISDSELYAKWFDEIKYGSCGTDEEDPTKASCPDEIPVRCDSSMDNCPVKHRFLLKTVTPPEDNPETSLYEAVYSSEVYGHITLIRIAFDIDDTGSELKLIIHDLDSDDDTVVDEEEFDLDEVKALWDKYINDYHDSLITSEEINEIYFNGKLESGFMDDRASDLENGVMITTKNITHSNEKPDSFFDIELEIIEGDEVVSSSIRIRVNRIDMALYLSFQDPITVVDVSFEEATTMLSAYKKGYDHYASSSQMSCAASVVDYQVEECEAERELMLENGYTLVDFNLEIIGENYVVELIFKDADMNEIKKTKFVFFFADEDTYLLAFYDKYVGEVDNDEVDLLLEDFVKNTSDDGVLTVHVCHFLSGGSDGEDNDCDGIVSKVRDNEYEFILGEVEDLGDTYLVEFIYRNDTVSFSEFYYFTFYYDEDLSLKATVNMLDNKLFFYTDIYTLIGNMNDYTVPVDEVCSLNIHEDSLDRCLAIRDYHESNGYILFITEISVDDQMNATILTVTYDSDGAEVEQNTFVISYMRNANGENPLHIESKTEGNNPLFD
jgi:hypothetical protein